MTSTTPKKLITTRELAPIIGVSHATTLAWYRSGVIPAEIAEDNVYRFDPEKVLAALRDRAAAKQKGGGK